MIGAGREVFATGRLPFGDGGTSKPTGNLSPQKQTHTNDKYYRQRKGKHSQMINRTAEEIKVERNHWIFLSLLNFDEFI